MSKAAIVALQLPASGSRVGAVSMPGQWPRDNPGTVLCHVEDRWGTHALVLRDTGETCKVYTLTECGIGWYQL